jgi:hypothetical protein
VQVEILEDGFMGVSSAEIGSAKAGSAEIGSIEVGVDEVSVGEVGSAKVGSGETCSIEMGPTEIGSIEVGVGEVALLRRAPLRSDWLRSALVRKAPLRRALVRLGRMPGLFSLHAFQVVTSCWRRSRCCGSAIVLPSSCSVLIIERRGSDGKRKWGLWECHGERLLRRADE